MPALNKIQQSFRRSLKTYDENAFVQLEIAETLIKVFSGHCIHTRHFPQVLELGCGTGFLTKALLNAYSVQELYLNDLVEECEPVLVEQLRSFVGKQLHSWEFVSGDINKLNINEQYNLVCSSSSLQWVNDLPVVLMKIASCLRSKGWLVLSSFGSGHFFELNELNQSLGNKSLNLNYATETQWNQLLESEFEIKSIESQTITVWFDSVEEMLKHLRNTGVNGNARQQWSQKSFNEFARSYESKFAKQGRLPLSYEPIFIIAQKN